MDRTIKYKLKIRLICNPQKARKDISYYAIDKKVESDKTHFKDLVQSIVNRYPPGYLEVAHVHYYDAVLNIFSEIQTDQELMFMFDSHLNSKIVNMFIAYVDPSEPYHPITKWDFEDQRKPMEKETRNSEPEPNEDTSLQNPLPKNEHVGIDEEGMYLTSDSNVVANVNLVVSCDKRKDTDYDPEDDGDGDESEGAQSEDVEEEEELIHEEEDKI
ncbi:unnamed protein product [Urochloa humidicola]